MVPNFSTYNGSKLLQPQTVNPYASEVPLIDRNFDARKNLIRDRRPPTDTQNERVPESQLNSNNDSKRMSKYVGY